MPLTLLSAVTLLGLVNPTPVFHRASKQVFALGAANRPTNVHDGVGAGCDTYKTYSGDGSASSGWPDMAQWVSFGDMFVANQNLMRASCVNLGPGNGPDNSDEEIEQIWDAVQSASTQTNVDHRFILAILLQESSGCVRVRTTDNGVPNPGLMQAHDGGFSCNTNGNIQTPCPASEIDGMVLDGVAGTLSGDGLAGILNQVGGEDARAYYRAARQYNTGSIAEDGNLDEGGYSTDCYASDIANRLTGWVWAESGCSH
ncbi:uncharacterized protein Z520_04449 [Fonsecaea multimorphosa CBS 102226]|uniref:Transglycosylase SLT domain-containing protein n=1 Tax=Fonsecaea multimorphosa CBS 102226 TaxID=1442371 RepID=A0A0D2KSX0_9EURO|nr:uncharacterized protein Z520_04449 [Fonsecaea multimorphosa CBS 102226]KIX99813.1 hypothetical protein Z520_04449 [Fonsecaea multimorphosa CBS 102226]OAL26473.1 hypothetical protein AYO22_04211 [Fonsecaea multimorphosa]